MTSSVRITNNVRFMRSARGWSQLELSRRAGLSRAGISLIETGALVPSTAAALSLARAFDCSVERLFSLGQAAPPQWAWSPASEPARFWRAEVRGRELLYPVEPCYGHTVAHDGVGNSRERRGEASMVLVIATCDPAIGMLAQELQRDGIPVLAFSRSSRTALELLERGLVHVAGIHLGKNVSAARERLSAPFNLLRVARWEEGLAARQDVGSAREAVGLKLVGREHGSGARLCLDEILGVHKAPRMIARDHRGVAEAIRCGWADAGVCVRLASEEAGLRFFSVRQEAYDLCFSADMADDPGIKALVRAVRSAAYRDILADLPGYETSKCGELQMVS